MGVAVQYRKKNNKRHQENVRKNLKVVQDFIINTPKSKPLVLGINTHDLVQEEEEVHDACHDETKYNDNNNDDNKRKSKKKEEGHDACHDETKYNNNQRRRRKKNKKSTISKQNHLQFTLNYKPEISLVNENDHHLPENNFWNTTIKKQHFKNNGKKKRKINQLLSFNNLTIDTSININLDEERFF